jgi:putative molybdopterin biosynthesis protein
MEFIPLPAFLTVNELADYLRVSIRTAYQLVTDGEVPSVRVKGQWRIPVDELERWRLEGGGSKRKARP